MTEIETSPELFYFFFYIQREGKKKKKKGKNPSIDVSTWPNLNRKGEDIKISMGYPWRSLTTKLALKWYARVNDIDVVLLGFIRYSLYRGGFYWHMNSRHSTIQFYITTKIHQNFTDVVVNSKQNILHPGASYFWIMNIIDIWVTWKFH